MNNIKDYREKELKLYIIANILLILVMSKIIFYNETTGNIDYVKSVIDFLNISLISGFMSIITFLLDSMYSSGIKSKFLNLCGLISQPGESVFSNIFNDTHKDNRINRIDASTEYIEIKNRIANLDEKSRKKYENSQWYKIYHKYRNEDMIFISNRDYLLCRDLYISSINIIVMYLIFSQIFRMIDFSIMYFISILIIAIISNISAQSKSKRMVYNVIAYDLSEKSKSKVNN
ncbi:hypothetical protein PN290_08825 [Romboutsia sp. 1001216sp1]|uniref:hypothetical protein n=1 Tax=Romboutsia TaxID=1501226 RepID=UPI000B88A806|nr:MULTISPECIES: hypothetical protein [Romboutsia]MDB8793196.1 hypothetical protein [Romboutsia sp. 1001216sp1]MDB8795988.1 hypothetical protein [Romboutsia sp. 1001216sp1]MDB8799484.1 hypothetical protein [Romboutsia sp. 1001216sp1]